MFIIYLKKSLHYKERNERENTALTSFFGSRHPLHSFGWAAGCFPFFSRFFLFSKKVENSQKKYLKQLSVVRNTQKLFEIYNSESISYNLQPTHGKTNFILLKLMFFLFQLISLLMPAMMSGWETTEETCTRENIAHFFLANQNSGILGI